MSWEASVPNTRIRRLKESTLAFRFKIIHCPGKFHSGPDALSRYPVAASIQDDEFAEESEALLANVIDETMQNLAAFTPSSDEMLTVSRLQEVCSKDEAYCELLRYVDQGFPRSKQEVDKRIVKFWGVKDDLYKQGPLVLKDGRIVIPAVLQSKMMKVLHSAHQGCSGMNSRASQTVFWPGMSKDIINFRLGCQHCAKIAPSQRKEPLILTPVPDWPFQHIVMDYCEHSGHTYLVVADRFSGWLNVFHFNKQATGARLVAICRDTSRQYINRWWSTIRG